MTLFGNRWLSSVMSDIYYYRCACAVSIIHPTDGSSALAECSAWSCIYVSPPRFTRLAGSFPFSRLLIWFFTFSGCRLISSGGDKVAMSHCRSTFDANFFLTVLSSGVARNFNWGASFPFPPPLFLFIPSLPAAFSFSPFFSPLLFLDLSSK